MTQNISLSKSAKVWGRLREDIICGRFKPGETLPSQRDLGKKFGVGEATVAAAMVRLAHEGLVQRRRRRGTVGADHQ